MSKLPFIKEITLICVISLIGVQKCLGVLPVKLQNNMIASTFTTFDEDGNLNCDAIPKLAQYYKKKGFKVIYICGYFGSAFSLPLRERKLVLDAWAKFADYFDIILEIGGMPFVDVLELARYSTKYNVTALTAFREVAYQASTLEESLEDLQLICDASCDTPLLSHQLERAPERIPPEAILQGAMDGGVSCWVGELISVSGFLSDKANVYSVAGYQLWSDRLDSIAAAYKTRMNATEAPRLFPELAFKIRDAAYNCDLDLAADLQQELNRKIYDITHPYGRGIQDETTRKFFARLKAGFEMLTGICVGYRYPLKRPSPAELNKIRSNLKKYGERLYNNCNNY